MTTQAEFIQLMGACSDFAGLFPEGVVFIDSVATYIHSINHEKIALWAETPHEASLYISLNNMADLREGEELVTNRRMDKHQLIKKGFQFDIYTERQSSLVVPYDEVLAHSITYDLFRVASLEHLLVLKMKAYQDRKGSLKGGKDARDLLRIAAIADAAEIPLSGGLILPYWEEQGLDALKILGKGSAPAALAKGNVHEARSFRRQIDELSQYLLNWQPPQEKPKLSPSSF